MFGLSSEQMMGLLSQLIRVGRVTSLDEAAASARVEFKDRSGIVSHEMRVVVRNTKQNKDYWIPDLQEQVLCLFLPNGIEQGYIIGSFYSRVTQPPAADGNKRLIEFDDGTVIEYDRQQHKLTAIVKGDVDLTVDGDVTAAVGGNITANVDGNVSATISGTLTADVSGPSTIKTPTLTVDGNLVVTGATQTVGLTTTAGLSSSGGAANISGNVAVSGGDVVADGISLRTHKHISAGSGNESSPPQ